jgi:Uma2 family endonuclease
MVLALATPVSEIELIPGSAIRLNDVSWQGYLLLLQELGEQRSTRLTYSDGVLEIRMPGQVHEVINRLLTAIILTLAETLDIDVNDLGSTTLNRPDLPKGIEPDSCFYIQNAQAGQGMEGSLRLPADLPPDLAIEVDIANSSRRKLLIYAAIGVQELWLYQQGQLTIQHLQADECYQSVEMSLAFPQISASQLNAWIELRKTTTSLTVIRRVRAVCDSF